MIWPSNGRPKAKGSMMTDDSMMTVWVRKGLIPVIFQISLSACKFSVCVILLLHQYSPIILFYEYVQIKHTPVVY